MDECLIVAGLLEAIEQAQKSCDFVDGACDPDLVFSANSKNGTDAHLLFGMT